MTKERPPLFNGSADFREGFLVVITAGVNIGRVARFVCYMNKRVAILGMGESGKKEYPLTDFCPKYTSADQVYLCGGPNEGEIGIVVRENEGRKIHICLKEKNKKGGNEGIMEYAVGDIRPFKVSNDPAHSLSAWKERSDVVIPFFMEGELIETMGKDEKGNEIEMGVGMFRQYISFTQHGCPGLFCTIKQEGASRMIAFEKVFHYYRYGDGVTISDGEKKEVLGIVMSKAGSPFVWNVWNTMTAKVSKYHTNNLSRRDRERGIPLGRGEEKRNRTNEL
jgi:hypothetical protein